MLEESKSHPGSPLQIPSMAPLTRMLKFFTLVAPCLSKLPPRGPHRPCSFLHTQALTCGFCCIVPPRPDAPSLVLGTSNSYSSFGSQLKRHLLHEAFYDYLVCRSLLFTVHHSTAFYPLNSVTKPGSSARRPASQSAETPELAAKTGFTHKAAKQKKL